MYGISVSESSAFDAPDDDGTLFSAGEHSAPSLYGPIADGLIIKTVGLGRGLSRPEAEVLRRDCNEYRQQLSANGVNIPYLVGIASRPSRDEYVLDIIEEYIPDRGVGAPTISMIKMMLSSIRPLIVRQAPAIGPMVTGVDMKYSNFCFRNDSEAILVDTFPPIFTTDDGNVDVVRLNRKLHRFSVQKLNYTCCTYVGACSRMLKILTLEYPSIDWNDLLRDLRLELSTSVYEWDLLLANQILTEFEALRFYYK